MNELNGQDHIDTDKAVSFSFGNRVFWLYLLIAFLLRLPFFFRDYIDRDESTFILMGQSIVDGYLPYTELWDIKPPLIFFFFAGIIYIFGKSFVAIRLSGVLLVAITAFFTDRIIRSSHAPQWAVPAAVACIYLLSLFGSVQGVMSEHLTMALVVPALYGVMRFKSGITYFICGLLLGAALMIKLNLAYPVLLIGVLLGVHSVFRTRHTIPFNLLMILGLGIGLPIAGTFLPYYSTGEPLLWWNSVIEAPLAYSGQGRNSLLKMSPFLIPFMLLMLWLLFKKKDLLKSLELQLILAYLIGIVISFVQAGRINGHYLIQFYPVFLILLVGVFVVRVPITKSIRYVLILLMLLLPIETYLEGVHVVRHKITRGSFFNGEGFTVPDYLEKHSYTDNSVFFMEYHIGYWVLGKKPPTKAATQPSNIVKDEMFFAYNPDRRNGLEEIRYIMEIVRPDVVVTRANLKHFDEDYAEANTLLNTYLRERYQVLDTVEKAVVFRKLELLQIGSE